jgi:hypothetical protein
MKVAASTGALSTFSKQTLMGHLQATLSLEQLRVVADLPEAQAFLQDFWVTQILAGNSSMNAREGKHEDLLLSVAPALHHLRQKPRKGWSVQKISF